MPWCPLVVTAPDLHMAASDQLELTPTTTLESPFAALGRPKNDSTAIHPNDHILIDAV